MERAGCSTTFMLAQIQYQKLDSERKTKVTDIELYRETLADVLAHTGGKRILTVSETSRLLSKSRPWVREHLGITGMGITANALAWKLARDFGGGVDG